MNRVPGPEVNGYEESRHGSRMIDDTRCGDETHLDVYDEDHGGELGKGDI